MTASLLILNIAQAGECDYDKAYIAGLDTMAQNVPDMEQHAPYQVIEQEKHWLVRGYDGPGSPKGLIPNALINKITCKLEKFSLSE